MHYLYILQSQKDLTFYTGITGNISRRVKEHNVGLNRSTKHHIPYKLVYSEEFKTRLEARAREKYFKTGIGREFRDNLLKNIPR
jgi:putative endonuclease